MRWGNIRWMDWQVEGTKGLPCPFCRSVPGGGSQDLARIQGEGSICGGFLCGLSGSGPQLKDWGDGRGGAGFEVHRWGGGRSRRLCSMAGGLGSAVPEPELGRLQGQEGCLWPALGGARWPSLVMQPMRLPGPRGQAWHGQTSLPGQPSRPPSSPPPPLPDLPRLPRTNGLIR